MSQYSSLWESLNATYPSVQHSNHKLHVHRLHLPVKYLISDANEVVYPEGLHLVHDTSAIKLLGHLGAWHSHVLLFHNTSDDILENADITKELKSSVRNWARLEELVASYSALRKTLT